MSYHRSGHVMDMATVIPMLTAVVALIIIVVMSQDIVASMAVAVVAFIVG